MPESAYRAVLKEPSGQECASLLNSHRVTHPLDGISVLLIFLSAPEINLAFSSEMFFRFSSYLGDSQRAGQCMAGAHAGRSSHQEKRFMKRVRYSPFVFLGVLLLCSGLSAQQAAVSSSTSAAAVVPRLVNFSGKAIDQGKAVTVVHPDNALHVERADIK